MEVYLTATRTIPAVETIQVPEVFALAFISLMCFGAIVALWWAVESDRAIRPNRHKARWKGGETMANVKSRMMEPKLTTEDAEMDLHVWKKRGNEDVTDLYTVSAGKWAICVDATIETAMEYMQEYLENL